MTRKNQRVLIINPEKIAENAKIAETPRVMKRFEKENKIKNISDCQEKAENSKIP